jgi:SAM-dependent methyltransferase
MVVTTSDAQSLPVPPPARGRALEVLWHDLECGAYRADLALWRELAERARVEHGQGPILEVGAGTGRVALALARAGHQVTALDLDGGLLLALGERAADTELETVQGDARTFALGRRDFALCIAPMQTVQLLGRTRSRIAFLRRARAHLRPGGVVACAIVTALESFDSASGDLAPSAESVRVDGHLYTSRATRVRVRPRSIRIDRERRILGGANPVAAGGPADLLASERNVVELDRVSQVQLEREGIQAGLTPMPARSVPSTDEHVGSVVVMLRA